MNIATQSKPQIDEKGFKKIISTSVLGLAVIFIGIILFLLMNNESALNSNTYTYFFLIFIPFLVIDLIVANILLALGMMMLSPTIVSLPFKIMIFVAIDGWQLIIKGLANSFN